MNDAEQGKIDALIAALEYEEAWLQRDLRAIRGQIEEERRKLEKR